MRRASYELVPRPRVKIPLAWAVIPETGNAFDQSKNVWILEVRGFPPPSTSSGVIAPPFTSSGVIAFHRRSVEGGSGR